VIVIRWYLFFSLLTGFTVLGFYVGKLYRRAWDRPEEFSAASDSFLGRVAFHLAAMILMAVFLGVMFLVLGATWFWAFTGFPFELDSVRGR
jgi:hypothetical protein